MIGWKDIGKGVIRAATGAIRFMTALWKALPADGRFDLLLRGNGYGSSPGGGQIEGVYIDTGENGVFSIDEFKAITSLGLMEFVTPRTSPITRS
jgi:hypothetical protein